jgi:hypothetical protein
MGYMSLINKSGFILVISILPALIMSYYARIYIVKHYEGHERFQFTSISVVFLLILSAAMCLFINRASMTDCRLEKRMIKSYKSLYVSAYGRTKTDVAANRFEIVFQDENNEMEAYVLKRNIFNRDPSGYKVSVEFCTSIFGLTMFREVVDTYE